MRKGLTLAVVLFLAVGMVSGCGSSVSENKPIAEVKSEAQTMSLDQLKSTVTKYKEAIEAKKPELLKLQSALKEIPITQLMGEDAAAIKKEISNVASSIKALTDRMKIYQSALNQKM